VRSNEEFLVGFNQIIPPTVFFVDFHEPFDSAQVGKHHLELLADCGRLSELHAVLGQQPPVCHGDERDEGPVETLHDGDGLHEHVGLLHHELAHPLDRAIRVLLTEHGEQPLHLVGHHLLGVLFLQLGH